jgi:hypothetical protein
VIATGAIVAQVRVVHAVIGGGRLGVVGIEGVVAARRLGAPEGRVADVPVGEAGRRPSSVRVELAVAAVTAVLEDLEAALRRGADVTEAALLCLAWRGGQESCAEEECWKTNHVGLGADFLATASTYVCFFLLSWCFCSESALGGE